MRPIDADRLLTERMKRMYYHLPNGDTAIPIIDIEHAPTIKTKQIKYFDEDENVWKIGEVIVNSSEKPNNSKVSEIPTGSERSSE